MNKEDRGFSFVEILIIIALVIVFSPFLISQFNKAFTVDTDMRHKGVESNGKYITTDISDMNTGYNDAVDIVNMNRLIIFQKKYKQVEGGLSEEDYQDTKDGVYPFEITNKIYLKYYIKNGKISKISVESKEPLSEEEINEFNEYAYFFIKGVYGEDTEYAAKAKETLFRFTDETEEHTFHDNDNYILFRYKINKKSDGYDGMISIEPFINTDKNKVYLD